MGTNYYLKTDYCPCCGHPRKKIHLGKSSYGYKFLFCKSKKVHDFKSFCEFLKTGVIENEYGEEIDEDFLLDLIESKQTDKENENVNHIGGYDFLEADFC